MNEMINSIANYGISIVIVGLFLWDWISNKNDIKNVLGAINETTDNISKCLIEMNQNNGNISKSLDLLQRSMDNQERKIDKILERRL